MPNIDHRPPENRLSRMLRPFAVLALLLTFAGTAIATTGDADDPPDHADLLARAADTAPAPIPVIVRLRADPAPDPAPALDADAAMAWRDRLAAIRERVLQRVPSLAGRGADTVDEVPGYKPFELVPGFAMQADMDDLAALLADPEVTEVVEDVAVPPALADSVPLIGADANGTFEGRTGAGQVIAILDSGVDKTHPFLKDKVVSEACYSSTIGSENATSLCPGGAGSSTASGSGQDCDTAIDGCGHGTHVAGIAAGKGASFSGVARDAKLIAIQVFSRVTGRACADAGKSSPCVFTYTSDQIRALERVHALRASFAIAAVNMSLGGGKSKTACDGDPRKPAIDGLRGAGIATVVASGNERYSNALDTPACVSTAVSVGATSKNDVVSSFSNSASMLHLLAPGDDIRSSVPGGGFGFKDGTSMAAPHVAGAWAVLKSAKITASVSEVLDALTRTGQPIRDTRNGLVKPRIQVDDAVTALLGGGGGDEEASAMISPANGATITGASVTFRWTDVDADEYSLNIGTRGVNSTNFYNRSQGTGTSRTFNGIPRTSTTIYVRLWTRHVDDWLYNDYTYRLETR